MNSIKLNLDYLKGVLPEGNKENFKNKAVEALEMLHDGTGKGSDFPGWLKLPG